MTLHYRQDLKPKARTLRTNMTDAEQLLWHHLRRRQILGIQFFRQRPIGNCIADFYAPAIHLVIEVDGGQHLDPAGMASDARRTAMLVAQRLEVIRYDNLQVLTETVQVLEEIYRIIGERKSLPPCRPRVPLHRDTVSRASGMPLETPAQPSL